MGRANKLETRIQNAIDEYNSDPTQEHVDWPKGFAASVALNFLEILKDVPARQTLDLPDHKFGDEMFSVAVKMLGKARELNKLNPNDSIGLLLEQQTCTFILSRFLSDKKPTRR